MPESSVFSVLTEISEMPETSEMPESTECSEMSEVSEMPEMTEIPEIGRAGGQGPGGHTYYAAKLFHQTFAGLIITDYYYFASNIKGHPIMPPYY